MLAPPQHNAIWVAQINGPDLISRAGKQRRIKAYKSLHSLHPLFPAQHQLQSVIQLDPP